MSNDEWKKLTTDEKLTWLRSMAEERLQQANNNAEKLTRLAWTMDLKLNDHAAEIGRLVEKVQALERGNPSRED